MKNAYKGHGAVEIDNDNSAGKSLTVAQCQQRCTADPVCECVVRYNKQVRSMCWKRKHCEPSKFSDSKDYKYGHYDTYMKNPKKFCAKNGGDCAGGLTCLSSGNAINVYHCQGDDSWCSENSDCKSYCKNYHVNPAGTMYLCGTVTTTTTPPGNAN